MNTSTGKIEANKIEYPKFFLQLRGKTIYKSIEGLVSSSTQENNHDALKKILFQSLKKISLGLFVPETIQIPFDLAASIFELDKLARQQCNQIIKPQINKFDQMLPNIKVLHNFF